MTLANPIFLWALAGISIPLVIHLLSKKEGKVIKLGSLRHVLETSTQQFRGIRLNEIPLLLLRIAIITVFSLILADVLYPGARNNRWVLVEKGLHRQPRIKIMIDSLASEGYEIHWLTKGYPPLSDSIISNNRVNYRELVIAISRKELSDVIVFATNQERSFSGLAAAQPGHIRWISQPAGEHVYPLKSFKVSTDSSLARKGYSDANATTYEYAGITSVSPDATPLSEISVAINADVEHQQDKRVVVAALKALKGFIPAKIVLQVSGDTTVKADWRIWMTKGTPAPGNNIIMDTNDDRDTPLITQTSSSQWTIHGRLNEDVAIRKNLTVELAGILVPGLDMKTISVVNDRRMLPDSTVWSYQKNDSGENLAGAVTTDSAAPILIVVLLIILTTERIVAFRRNQ